jgi:hypothetical protein
MFIAHYPNGVTITESDMIWDKLPDGLTNLQLALPVTFKIKDSQTNEVKEAPAPTVTLGRYDAYYFENEAVAAALVNAGGQLMVGQTVGTKSAQIIGGIDYKAGIVVQIRVDKFANVKVSRFPVDELRRSESSLKKSK